MRGEALGQILDVVMEGRKRAREKEVLDILKRKV